MKHLKFTYEQAMIKNDKLKTSVPTQMPPASTRKHSRINELNKKLRGIMPSVDWNQLNHYMDGLIWLQV